MKNLILIAASVCMTVILNIGCQSSVTKIENDKEEVQELNKDVEEVKSDLNHAKQDLAADYQQFKKG